MAIDPRYLTSVEEDHNDRVVLLKAVQRAPTVDCQKRQLKTHLVLNEAGISKRKKGRRR